MADPIPFLDLASQLEPLRAELDAALARVLRSGRFVLGPEVDAFEREAASYLGVRHAVGLNSGTDALVIGLRALGVRPGDEVITTPFTFFATAEAISLIGARPVFADVHPESFNLDPAGLASRITPRTRALLPVHLFGLAADMDGIEAIARAHGLEVLEDAAQAFGASYRGRKLGTLGGAGAFSFYPSKNLPAAGDAGMLVTDRDDVAATARLLRNHGQSGEYRYETLGYNSRLDELQAAVLRIGLRRVDDWNAARRRVADVYRGRLRGRPRIAPPVETPGAHHIYHQYTVRATEGIRDRARAGLERAGIATRVYYPVPLHTLPLYAEGARRLPVAERLADEVLSLPMGPWLTPAQVERIAETLAAVSA